MPSNRIRELKVHTYFTPNNSIQVNGENETVVVIDTLRMTSVAITALQHGCLGVKPFDKSDENVSSPLGKENMLIGGERNGLKIPGYDLGNSPLEYTRERMENNYLLMNTTNGTKAILSCLGAKALHLGAFINAAAVAKRLKSAKTVKLVCAGTRGEVTMEDVLTAGAIIERLLRQGERLALDDASLLSLRAYRMAQGNLWAALGGTGHFRYLFALGEAFQKDLRYCLQEDITQCVPTWDGAWFR